MKKMVLILTLVFTSGMVSAEVKKNVAEMKPLESNNKTLVSGTVICADYGYICAAIMGQLTEPNFSGWVNGCLVIGGTPSYCILK